MRKLDSSLVAKAVLIAIAVVLFVYIARREHHLNEFTGCYDCGWKMRQALFLVIGTIFLLFRRIWTAVISLLAALKVVYTIGYVAFFNNVEEVRGVGPPLWVS